MNALTKSPNDTKLPGLMIIRLNTSCWYFSEDMQEHLWHCNTNMAKKENGNTVKSFILRVDAEMMEAIEAWAADEFRSTNGQIQYILDQALRKAGRLKKKRKQKNEEEEKE